LAHRHNRRLVEIGAPDCPTSTLDLAIGVDGDDEDDIGMLALGERRRRVHASTWLTTSEERRAPPAFLSECRWGQKNDRGNPRLAIPSAAAEPNVGGTSGAESERPDIAAINVVLIRPCSLINGRLRYSPRPCGDNTLGAMTGA